MTYTFTAVYYIPRTGHRKTHETACMAAEIHENATTEREEEENGGAGRPTGLNLLGKKRLGPRPSNSPSERLNVVVYTNTQLIIIIYSVFF